MKGQMFIVTMIFLVGLVFIVQQTLLQYSDIDVSASFRNDPFYFLENMEPLYADAIAQADDCRSFTNELQEMEAFLEQQTLTAGVQVEIDAVLDCAIWDPIPSTPLTISIALKGGGIDAAKTLSPARS